MAVYVVGDVQGCYEALCCVLEQVRFDRARDRLWLVGDLVNRGPQSLEVLRLVQSLGASATVVLGNHDLHLLAIAEGRSRERRGDTLGAIWAAGDREALLDCLRCAPLLHVDEQLGYCMVHAGIPPHWGLAEARERAAEAERWLRSAGFGSVVAGPEPEPLALSPELGPAERARVIVAYFTRMRVCTADGWLNLKFKGRPAEAPPGYLPWFAHPGRKTRDVRIVFGHWAALEGRVGVPDVYALDTGCVWGRSLTAMCLDDGRRVSCSCVNLRRAT